jgi:hypothetical protein
MLRVSRSVFILFSALALVATGLGGTAALGDHDDTKLTAKLTGRQEVPQADPDGEGKAKVKIDVAAGRACFELRFDDTGTPSRGHIHQGARGVNGPIVVAFFELRSTDAPATDARHDALEEGALKDCVSADAAVLQDIAANPDGYYVNLHNARFPGGAIRGQLDD